MVQLLQYFDTVILVYVFQYGAYHHLHERSGGQQVFQDNLLHLMC